MIHSLVEGAAMGSGFTGSSLVYLAGGVLIHKIPAGLVISYEFSGHSSQNTKMLIAVTIFCLATPLGIWMFSFLPDHENWLMQTFGALVAGSFLHISMSLFMESKPEHHIQVSKLIAGIAGMAVAAIPVLVDFFY